MVRSRRQGSDSIGLHFRKVIAAHPVEAGLEVGKPEAERPVRREFEKPVEARGDEGLGRGGDGWRITTRASFPLHSTYCARHRSECLT